MKNNANTKYMLIALTIAIWGLIIYRVLSGLSDDEVVAPRTQLRPVTENDGQEFRYTLAEGYPDPFNNILPVYRNENLVTPADTVAERNLAMQLQGGALPAPAVPPPVTEQPPAIRYNGYIYNPSARKRTALISYAGTTMIVREGDRIGDNTRIIRIEQQRITVNFKKQTITIGIGM